MNPYGTPRCLYQAARIRADAALRTKTDYALGNTALALGDFPAAIRHHDDCLASTARGADLDRVRRDAALNRRFVEEQARRSIAPPDPREGNPSNRPPGGGEPPGDDGSASGPGGGDQKPGDGSPTGKRGAGGAGGSGASPPQAGSPEEQLSKALDNVREARRRRIEETTTADDRDDRKDW